MDAEAAPGDGAAEREASVPPSEQAPGRRPLGPAVATAVVLLGLLTVVAFIGRTAFFVLATTVVLIALYELLDAAVRSGRRPSVPFGLVCGLGMLVVAYLRRPEYFAVVLAISMYGAFLIAMRPGRGSTPASDVGWTLLGVAWVSGGGAGAVSILMIEPKGLSLLISFVLTVAAGDIGAYFAGTAFGKHRMAPSISPHKSWEGFAGGFPCAVIAGLAFSTLFESVTPADGLAIGALCGVLAPIGDLLESLAKRELGIKDSGRLLPGHGGFLDRLDAIMFCAPAVYLYLIFVAELPAR